MASRRIRPERLRLAAFLPYRLNVVAAVVSEGLARRYASQFGIGIPEWRVLATVGEFGRITAGAIGQHARMHKVKVSRAATALERRGLIARAANAEDRREAFLGLTPSGEALYGRIAPLALAYADELAAAIPPADMAALDRALDALLAQAGRMDAALPSRLVPAKAGTQPGRGSRPASGRAAAGTS